MAPVRLDRVPEFLLYSESDEEEWGQVVDRLLQERGGITRAPPFVPGRAKIVIFAWD